MTKQVNHKQKCDYFKTFISATYLFSHSLDSERQMVLATRTHAVKNEMLKEEEVQTRDEYENLLRQHLIEEKNQRARRYLHSVLYHWYFTWSESDSHRLLIH